MEAGAQNELAESGRDAAFAYSGTVLLSPREPEEDVDFRLRSLPAYLT